jgi:phospholipid/cholesterol/gamma-HCH transport system substrate-binding protein
MENTNAQKLKLGIFVIISVIILVISLYLIGSKQNLFGKSFKIHAVFNDVNGLQQGNNVQFSGIKIGTVKKIEMINDTTIRVDMIIEEKMRVHLKKNAQAVVKSDGLVGNMTVSIVPVEGNAPFIKEGDTIVAMERITMDEMMATLGTTNEDIAILVKDVLKITDNIEAGKGVVGLLLNDEEITANIKNIVSNVENATVKANKTVDELNKIIGSINYDESLAAVLLSDAESAKKIKSIISNLETTSVEINKVVANVNDVVMEVKDGDGILNYIVNDTMLAKNIDSTMQNVKIGTGLLNENLEALKHNIFFRGYFKKQEKAKAKELEAKEQELE